MSYFEWKSWNECSLLSRFSLILTGSRVSFFGKCYFQISLGRKKGKNLENNVEVTARFSFKRVWVFVLFSCQIIYFMMHRFPSFVFTFVLLRKVSFSNITVKNRKYFKNIKKLFHSKNCLFVIFVRIITLVNNSHPTRTQTANNILTTYPH